MGDSILIIEAQYLSFCNNFDENHTRQTYTFIFFNEENFDCVTLS